MNLTALLHSQSQFHCSKGSVFSFIKRLLFSITAFFLFSFFAELKAQTGTISVNDNNVCIGDPSPTLTFNGNGGTPGYVFEYTINGGGSIFTAAGDPILVAVPTGTSGTITYHLIGIQDNNGAGASVPLNQTVVVTVNALPATPDITPHGPITLQCPTSTVSLSTPSYGGGFSYQWYERNLASVPVPIAGETTRTYVADNGGIYSLVVTNNATGCSSDFSNEVTVTHPPKPTFNAGVLDNASSVQECSPFNPGVIDFSTNPTGGRTPYTYQWYRDGNPIAGENGNSYDPPTFTGTRVFHVVVTDNCGEALTTNDITITINTPPTATATNNGPVCTGDNITLSTPNVTNATYNWTGPGGFNQGGRTQTINNANAGDAGLYTVTVTLNGCDNQSSTTVVVNAPPTATATNNGPVCTGGNITLSTPNVTNATYNWTGPG
ncbi:MAG: hypothetical protein ABI675_31195, partial [Chitinophagaceae bacterium]